MFINTVHELIPDISETQKVEIVDGKPTLVNSMDRTYERTSLFPIVADISAGAPFEAINDYDAVESIEVPIRYIPYGTDAYIAFRVNGGSTEQQILHNDIALIKKNKRDGTILMVKPVQSDSREALP